MPKWTPEQAREMGRKGGLARANNRADPKARHKKKILDNIDSLSGALVDAALRRGIFSDRVEVAEDENGEVKLDKKGKPIAVFVPGISYELQMKALVNALYWGVGRPTTEKPESDDPPNGDEPDEPEEGIGFVGTEEDEPEAHKS